MLCYQYIKRVTFKNVFFILLTFSFFSCKGQGKDKPVQNTEQIYPAPFLKKPTTFPQIHSNLNGKVREFVRTMFQDKKGNYWFGTNGDGIIRYDGKHLETMTIEGMHPNFRVLEIVEDQIGHLWFATSEGLLHYDGQKFFSYANNEGLQSVDEEIWGLTFDKSGRLWVGSVSGVRLFDGKKFTPFTLPDTKVENQNPMLSAQLVFKIIEDQKGTMWFATDGNGIFTYKNGEFTHLTTKNGLSDNHVADILEDTKGNIWLGSFYGGVSKYDGKKFSHFTKDGIIKGEEAYNLYEDSRGQIWFTAEGFGVYRYDGTHFTQYTSDDGLTTNVVQRILEDNKGQYWFGTWQGVCIFDGQKFADAKEKESWTK